MSDSRDSNHDGRVSFLEKIKDKLHLGHKDQKDGAVTYHTAPTQPAAQSHPDCPGCKALASQQSYQPGFGGQIYQPLGYIPETYANGAYNPGYDTTCQGCVAERLAAGASGVRGNTYDSRDLNRDGYVSTGEKLASNTGSYPASSFPAHAPANVDSNRRHSLNDSRDRHHLSSENRERRHSLGDKFANTNATSEKFVGPAVVNNGRVYDPRDRNGDGHVSFGEKFAKTNGSRTKPYDYDRNGDDHISIGGKMRPPSSQTFDLRDRNGDGHVSMEEKLAGPRAVGSYDSRDRNTDRRILGERLDSKTPPIGTYDPRDRNRDGHVSLSEKLPGSRAGVGAYDSRDRNHDGHVSLGEKIASRSRSPSKNETRLTLHEERLVVVKGEVSAGEVSIRKHVQEEHVEQSVPVMHEEFVVERRPLNGVASEAVASGADEVSRVTLYSEQIVRHRRLVPTEEVIVRKKIVTEQETVGDTLRSERFETTQMPAPNAAPTSIGGIHDARDLNRDGHVSTGEKLAAAATGTASRPTSDIRDLNGDGHVSTSEKLQAEMGTGSQIAAGNETRLRLHEEQLAVSKQEVSAGEVDIIKRVQEEFVQQSIPVKREELVVERRPITGADFKPGATTPDELMRFTLYREEIVVEKRRIPMEEVIVRKKLVTKHELVSDTLRSEHVEVKQVGSLNSSGLSDARDTNRDGHVSTKEKLQAAVGPSNLAPNAAPTSIGGIHDARDLNRDGHVSTGEKLAAAATGTASRPTSDIRDLNGDGHVSTSEKLQAEAEMGGTGFQARG